MIFLTNDNNFHKYITIGFKQGYKNTGNIHIHRYFENTQLTHWDRVTHICVSNLTITASDNGLSPGRRQAIIWTNSAILLIGPLAINFSEILIAILTFSFKKMRLKLSSAKRQPFCLGLNVLSKWWLGWGWKAINSLWPVAPFTNMV